MVIILREPLMYVWMCVRMYVDEFETAQILRLCTVNSFYACEKELKKSMIFK